MGGRASVDLIRSDAEEAVLEAAFSLPADHTAMDCLRDAGLLGPDGTDLIIRRVLSRTGRNRIYCNGTLTPLNQIQALAGTLIDIHGQHEQQSLLCASAQLDALDAFGHLKELRRDYARQYEQWQARRRDLEEARRAAAERSAREEFLRFQHRELEEAAVEPGEEEALAAECRRLSHTHRLGELSADAYELLYGGETSTLSVLGTVNERLKELAVIDPETVGWGALCAGATVHLRELAERLRDYRGTLEHDPDRLAVVEERLDRIQRLKKKYGGTVESLLDRMKELKQHIDAIATAETRVAELQQHLAQDFARVEALANQLSDGRAQAAAKMEKRVKEELAALRMDHTRFQIVVSREAGEAALRSTGRDRVEYLLAANEGEPLLPLARVASGGELSRVMLAMKTVLAETDRVPVLIFDEVDAGIGGAVASVLGRRLRALGDYHQVFCITHLPQIASQATSHFAVQKTVVKKRTVVLVSRLDQEGRCEEVARMLGGTAITKAVRETAAEMIRDTERDH